jgi:hypothetical protein
MSKFTCIKVKDFKPTKSTFTNFSKTERSSQPISYCDYDGQGNLVLQTDWISMDFYGIPKKDDKYYTDDEKRSFMKIPLREGQPASDCLREKLEEFDEYLESDEIKQKLLIQKDKDGKIPSQKDIEKILKKTIYEQCIKEPQSDPNYNGPETERPKYMKGKFKINYKTKELATKFRKMETKMCDDGKDFEICVDERGAPIGEDISDQIKTVSDLEALKIVYKSKCRFLLMLSKLWNASSKYGPTWKIHKVEIAPRPYVSSGIDTNVDFDDNNEYQSNKLSTKKNSNKGSKKVNTKELDGESESEPEASSSDSSSESESESEPEPEPEPETKKKGGKRGKTLNSST